MYGFVIHINELVTNKKRCGSLKFTLEHQYLI